MAKGLWILCEVPPRLAGTILPLEDTTREAALEWIEEEFGIIPARYPSSTYEGHETLSDFESGGEKMYILTDNVAYVVQLTERAVQGEKRA